MSGRLEACSDTFQKRPRTEKYSLFNRFTTHGGERQRTKTQAQTAICHRNCHRECNLTPRPQYAHVVCVCTHSAERGGAASPSCASGRPVAVGCPPRARSVPRPAHAIGREKRYGKRAASSCTHRRPSSRVRSRSTGARYSRCVGSFRVNRSRSQLHFRYALACHRCNPSLASFTRCRSASQANSTRWSLPESGARSPSTVCCSAASFPSLVFAPGVAMEAGAAVGSLRG